LFEDNKNRWRDTVLNLLSKFKEKKIFCTKSLQAMKSGFFMITLNVENHKLTLTQNPISTPRRFCSVSGGIGKICCYELLQPDETITADRCQQQLTNLSDAFEEKRPFTGQERHKVILLAKDC